MCNWQVVVTEALMEKDNERNTSRIFKRGNVQKYKQPHNTQTEDARQRLIIQPDQANNISRELARTPDNLPPFQNSRPPREISFTVHLKVHPITILMTTLKDNM